MNRFFCLQAKSRRLQIYTVLRAISRLFSAIMQYRSKLNAKTRTQTLYQYLSPLVCLHSYNDTVNANAEVIIEHRFAAIQQRKGCKILTHTSSRSIRLCSKNSVNSTSVTKSEISRFRSRRPLPPDPYCSAPTQPPPLAAAWPWQVIGKNAKLNRRRDTFVSEISEFRHRRRD